MLCLRHFENLDERLDCCWKCLSEERDPKDASRGSWWWCAYCKCAIPDPAPYKAGTCLICGEKLRREDRGLGQAA